MNNELPSGSILPSGLLENDRNSSSAFDKAYKNYDLKMGIVIAMYDVEDEKNINKTSVEYDVAVIEQLEDLGQTVSTYHNCVAKDLFGGIADYFEYKYRVQTTTNTGTSEQKDHGTQNGSLVLLLCLNGSDDSAIIIGGLNHPQRKTKLTKEAGIAMFGEFNGLELSVDKFGALRFFFKGATDIDGKPLDEKVGGSIMEINKDGSIKFSDGNKEMILVDKVNKTIVIEAEKDISISSQAKIKLSSKDAAEIKSKDIIAKAEGSIVISGESCDIKIEGAFTADAASFTLNTSGVITIKGQQVTLSDMVFLGAAGGSPALMMSTSFMGIGNKGQPVISQAIGPYSSKVFIAP